ncbi:MAG TPA: class I SAM-dependent methyltransferase [Gaiellaceae bacterium]|nr:class I SAM-dependent methyltransferase [Gaiellaceae bacterium]
MTERDTSPCLACGRSTLLPVMSFGEMPLANALLSAADLDRSEQRFPLELAFCEPCALLQITESVDPELLFGEYAYFSSYSTTMLDHAAELVTRLVRERELDGDDLAMEIASNDGYLLQHYARAGVPVLGIDPARNVVEAARKRGVETLCAFFGEEVAQELAAHGRCASVLHANNVLAHVPDVNGFLGGVASVLAAQGVAVIETPYVRELVERTEFDTVYHEHLFYYSLTALERLFARNGLRIVDVERLAIHGGSLRIFATRVDARDDARPSVKALLDEEDGLGMSRPGYFENFAARVDELRDELWALLRDLKSQGHRLAAYGAAAKGSTLLNSFGIGREMLEFVADRSQHKQGLYMPGVRLPIVPVDRLLEEMPDEVLLLAWNFAEEILEQQAEYRGRGGRFIIPIPHPRLV